MAMTCESVLGRSGRPGTRLGLTAAPAQVEAGVNTSVGFGRRSSPQEPQQRVLHRPCPPGGYAPLLPSRDAKGAIFRSRRCTHAALAPASPGRHSARCKKGRIAVAYSKAESGTTRAHLQLLDSRARAVLVAAGYEGSLVSADFCTRPWPSPIIAR